MTKPLELQILCPITGQPINYIAAVLRTAAVHSGVHNLYHAVVGIRTELDEILDLLFAVQTAGGIFDKDQEENLVEELGDLLWYTMLALRTINSESGANFRQPTELGLPIVRSTVALMDVGVVQYIRCLHQCGRILTDMMKKELYYRKAGALAGNVRTESMLIKTIELISLILEHLNTLGGEYTLQQLAQANANKLAKRYPEGKFSLSASDNRNVDSELSAMWDCMLLGS